MKKLKEWMEGEAGELFELCACFAVLLALWLLPAGTVRAVLLTALWLFAGREVFIGMVKGFGEKEFFSEEALMSVASLGAIVLGEHPEAAAVMLFYRLGEWFADYAEDKSRGRVEALASLRPDRARVVRDGETTEVSPQDVRVGEIILVRPGERVPLDGVIVEGATEADTSAMTGESLPAAKGEGDELFEGCVNLTGAVKMRVIAAAEDSAVSRILKLTGEAAGRKASGENFIERFAKIYTPAVFALAAALFLIPWLLTGDAATWGHRALTFLTVSCPCALVVSVPLAFFCGIGTASRRGVLIKGGMFIERLAKADICAFDKTGTLTTGAFALGKVSPVGMTEEELLSYAAAAESFSSHPLARCIASSVSVPRAAELIVDRAGLGVKAMVDGHIVLVGSERLLREENVTLPEGASGVLAAVDGTYAGCLEVTDTLKPSVLPAMKRLKELGMKKAVLLSGDRKAAAEKTGRAAGMDEIYAELLPKDKTEHMRRLTSLGTVLYTGDGVNDAPVLAAADVGCAMGGLGSDAAIEAADVVIMDDALNRLPEAVSVSRRTLRVARQNIVLPLAVKLVILVLGAVMTLPMTVAVAGDVGVLILVTLNALRLLR